MKAYIAGALTQVDGIFDHTAFYESVADVCKQEFIEPYVPHLVKQQAPSAGAIISPRRIFYWDVDHLKRSDLIIAYVGLASLGVGIELGIAGEMGMPTVILYEANCRISPMVLGLPTLVTAIEFTSEPDCWQKLTKTLKSYVRVVSYADKFLSDLLRERRKALGLTQADIAIRLKYRGVVATRKIVSEWERGVRQIDTQSLRLCVFADVLEWNYHDLMNAVLTNE